MLGLTFSCINIKDKPLVSFIKKAIIIFKANYTKIYLSYLFIPQKENTVKNKFIFFAVRIKQIIA